ncbi:MAG TPA: extracellular solute-binding protein [Chloroflexota bacterium]|nr:extracellular solute-binding protein [Chloroflexota bacterium]
MASGHIGGPTIPVTRTTRRRLVLGASASITGLAGVLAAACGQIPVDPIAPARSYRSPGPAKLLVQLDGTWETHRVLREQLLPIFKRRHANIEVTLRTGAVELPTLRREVAAGGMPDVALFSAAQVPALAEAKLTVPLDSRLASWGQLGDFLPNTLTSSQWSGKQWGLPFTTEVRLHLWRKNVLADVEIDRIPTTWDEAVDAIRRSVLVERGAIVREGNPRPEGWTAFSAALLTLGKTFITAGHAECGGTEGVAAMAHINNVYKATRPTGNQPIRGRVASFPFASGSLAHTVESATTLRAFAQTNPQQLDDVVIGDPPVPAMPSLSLSAAPATPQVTSSSASKIRPTALLSTDWLAIGSLSTAQDQAWAFLQYLLEPSTMLAFNETRYFLPPRKSLGTMGYLRQPHLQRTAEVASRFGQSLPRVPDDSVFRNTLRNAVDDMFAGRTTPEDATAAVTRRLQQEVERLGFKGDTA